MDFIVFSHLRWDFVYQRPQHLLSRAARRDRVIFWEEPVVRDIENACLDLSPRTENLTVVVPHVPSGLSAEEVVAVQRELLADLLKKLDIKKYACWYYNPLAIEFSQHLRPAVTVYDCMDQLTAFRGAPPGLRAAEEQLFRRADVVFTGGQSLYECKREQHPNVHAFPSSIDTKHFSKARIARWEPADQASIPGLKAGFAGVIDERFDIELLRELSQRMPIWQFVIIGPVVKIDPSELPVAKNIHYLGAKAYDDLPAYMSGWDVGLLTFAMNESTRFISPTKTPEYLAAGLPVVSTPIRDVVRPYGEQGLVSIAQNAEQFARAIEYEYERRSDKRWRARVDAFLSRNSWDLTWEKMYALIDSCSEDKTLQEKAATVRRPSAIRMIGSEQVL